MIRPDEQDVIARLHKTNSRLKGICFTLAMRNDDGSIELYERENQPCYGELRKYKATHGDEATQPEGRPNDLKYPFPVGKPEALAIGFPHWNGMMKGEETKSFFDYLISNESPFIKGFGGMDNVEWSPNRKGIVLLDLKIDPTVLVNMLKHIQFNDKKYGHVDHTRFDSYRKIGMSSVQAFCATYAVQHSYNTVRVPHNYVYPTYADLGRIVRQNPFDLTGGTLADRFDYSRKRLHEIFYSEKTGVNVYAEIVKRAGGKMDEHRGTLMKEDDFFKYFFEVWNDYFNTERKEIAA